MCVKAVALVVKANHQGSLALPDAGGTCFWPPISSAIAMANLMQACPPTPDGATMSYPSELAA